LSATTKPHLQGPGHSAGGDPRDTPYVPNCSTCKTRHLSVCDALGPVELITFDHIVQHRDFPGHTLLFEEGAKADFVYSLSGGTVRLFRLLPDGRRQILGFAITGDFLGTTMSETHEYAAEAVDAIRICRIPRSGFQKMLDEKPHLIKKLHQVAGREMQQLQSQLVLVGRRSAEERVAAFLLGHRERLARVQPKSVTVPLAMSRQDIADFLGLTIETVSRTISKLAREKLIVVVPDGIRILEVEKLTAVAEG
jgi:CRP/FNR family transcriptional regulator